MTSVVAEEGLGPALPGMREGAHSCTANTDTSTPSARRTTGPLSAIRPPRLGKSKGCRSQRIEGGRARDRVSNHGLLNCIRCVELHNQYVWSTMLLCIYGV